MATCVESLYCAEKVSATTWDDEEGGECVTLLPARLVVESQPAVFLNFPVEDDEAISTLLLKEGQYMPEGDYSGRYHAQELSPQARLEAVKWIQKVQSFYNYGPLTVALAVNYMDRFLSRHHLPEGKDWMLQLLSVACVSLAAKMEESEVPILLDLQVEQVQHVFEAHTIQRMELLVLSTLEWRMSAVTPFSYIDYFFHKLGISNVLLRALLARVSEIVLKAAKGESCVAALICALRGNEGFSYGDADRVVQCDADTTFLMYLPSVVAAAAIICSLEEVTALQSGDLLRIFGRLAVDVDAVKECYTDMQQVVIDSCYRRLSMTCSLSLCKSEPQSPVGVLEAAALSSASDGTTGFSSRESSPGCGVAFPFATSSQSKRRKLLADDQPCRMTWE